MVTPAARKLALLALLLAACESTGPGILEPEPEPEPEPKILKQKDVEEKVADGQRQDLAFLVQATEPGLAKQTRTLDEARAAIEEDPNLEPLKEALTAGGWNAEQQTQMVYFAGTHQSGAAEDSIRYRQQQIHDELSAELARFRSDLAAAQEREGVRIDYDELRKAGVITTLKTEVIR